MRLLEAAKALVDKMDRIEASSAYQSVWTLSHIHGRPYRGENWKAEVDALREAVKIEEASVDVQ